MGLEEADNCQDPAMILIGFRQVQLLQDASDGLLDGPFGDQQAPRDACVVAFLPVTDLRHMPFLDGHLDSQEPVSRTPTDF